MKPKLRTHFAYYWWLYALSALLVAVFWSSVFAKLAEPRPCEQINITYIGSSFDHIALQRDLYDVLPNRTAQPIKRVSVENAAIEGEYDFNTILRARMAGSCDFLIVESSVLDAYELHLASYFPEADAEALSAAFGDAELVREDDKVFGVSCAANMKISDYYSGKSACKIFFNRNSLHLSDLFGGETARDAAVQIIRYLTEAKDVQT